MVETMTDFVAEREAMVERQLRRRGISEPEILELAHRVRYYVDPAFPGPGRFKGAVRITLSDGRVIEETQEHNLGSPDNPMSAAQLRAKFDDNAGRLLAAAERESLAAEIDRLERLDDASNIVQLAMPLMPLG